MKELADLSKRIGLHLKWDYYVIDMEKSTVMELVHLKKKSRVHQIQWAIELTLKTLLRLQRSIYFNRESHWQAQFSAHYSALSVVDIGPEQRMVALHQATDLIAVAHPIIETRTATLEALRESITLSEAEGKHYEAVRQHYQARNRRLNALNEAIDRIQENYKRLPLQGRVVEAVQTLYGGSMNCKVVEAVF